VTFGGTQVGWMGLRSVPITTAFGYLSATSIAHIPVPVPISMMSCGLSAIGAWKYRCPRTSMMAQNCISIRSLSGSSLGRR